MKAKPIALIKMPLNTTQETMQDARKSLGNQLNNDYHLIIVNDGVSIAFDMQVFSTKDFTDVEYEELKEIVEKAIE